MVDITTEMTKGEFAILHPLRNLPQQSLKRVVNFTHTQCQSSVLTNDISFFFGAGASKPFGIPTMTEMTENFKQELRTAEQQEQETYNEIVKLLQQDLDHVDIEAVFSVIDGLKRSNVDDFGESCHLRV